MNLITEFGRRDRAAITARANKRAKVMAKVEELRAG